MKVIQPSFKPTPACKLTEQQLRDTWERELDIEREIKGRYFLKPRELFHAKERFEKYFLLKLPKSVEIED